MLSGVETSFYNKNDSLSRFFTSFRMTYVFLRWLLCIINHNYKFTHFNVQNLVPKV